MGWGRLVVLGIGLDYRNVCIRSLPRWDLNKYGISEGYNSRIWVHWKRIPLVRCQCTFPPGTCFGWYPLQLSFGRRSSWYTRTFCRYGGVGASRLGRPAGSDEAFRRRGWCCLISRWRKNGLNRLRMFRAIRPIPVDASGFLMYASQLFENLAILDFTYERLMLQPSVVPCPRDSGDFT